MKTLLCLLLTLLCGLGLSQVAAPPAVAAPSLTGADAFAGAAGAPLESMSLLRRSGPMLLDGKGGASPSSTGQVHYDSAASYAAPFAVNLTVDLQGGTDAIGPAAFSAAGDTYATERVDAGKVQIILVVKNQIVGDVHSALAVPSGAVVHTLAVAADGTVTATAGLATCSLKSPVPLTVASIEGDHLSGPVARVSAFSVVRPETLFFLRRLRQYVPYVPGAATLDPEQTDLYSEGWSIETAMPTPYSATNPGGYQPEAYPKPSIIGQRPEDFTPPTQSAWHAIVDPAPLSIDPAQAGYFGYPADADRRTPTIGLVSTWVVALYWPIYAPDLASAKARFLTPIYSAGRAMTFEEWTGYLYKGVPVAWYGPTPMPWAGLNALGCFVTKGWADRPVPIVAPYDASVKLP